MTTRSSSRRGPGALWIGGRVPTSMIVNEPTPTRVELVVWFDATRDQILSGTVVPPSEPRDVLAAQLREVLTGRQVAPPIRVRVASDADASLVGDVLPGVPIEVGPTPELDHLSRLLSESAAGQGDVAPSYLDGGHLSAAGMGTYFEHMAGLWKAAPWRFLDDTQVLELDVPALDVRGACVVVLGASRVTFGASLYSSFDDFEQFMAVEPPSHDDRSIELGVATLGFTFERAAKLPESMRREVIENGWAVAHADAHPLLMPIDPDGQLRPATDRDVKLGCVTAAALVAVVRQYGRALRDGAPSDLSVSVVVATPEPLEVTIRFPHGLAPELASADRLPGEAAIEQARERGERRIEEFLVSEGIRERSEGWRIDARFTLGVFHDFKLDHADGRLEGLRPSHLAAFLLDFAPARVSLDDVMVRSVPETLEAYVDWLGYNGHEPRSVMVRARERVEGLRGPFARVAFDPKRFGAGKSFMMAARAAGVDVEDLEALRSFQATYNERLDRDGTGLAVLPPRSGRLRTVRVRREISRPRRWFALEGEDVPEPSAPCPCGSGRRYRKCCMER